MIFIDVGVLKKTSGIPGKFRKHLFDVVTCQLVKTHFVYWFALCFCFRNKSPNRRNMSTAVHWHADDIDDVLAADFDGSLSGLGTECGVSLFNMR